MPTEQEFDSLLELLYEAALHPSRWVRFVECLADGLNAAQGQLALVDVAHPANTLVRVVRFEPEAEKEYLRRRANEDVWWQRLPSAKTGQCFTGSDLIDTRYFLRSPLARDTGRSTDIAFMLEGWFHKHGEVLGVVSVLRGRSKHDFSQKERATLQRILPHLSRAMALHRRFQQASQRQHSLEAALNISAEATFLVGMDAHVFFLNSAAETLLSKRMGVVVEGGRLSLKHSAAQNWLQRVLRKHIARDCGDGHRFMGASGVQHRLLIRAFPLAQARPDVLSISDPHLSAVVISDTLSADEAPPLGLLVGFYGLTRAEAIIASHVAAGRRLQQIAQIEGRSIHTVRAQLKACFNRLGVDSQAALVRRLHVLNR